MSPGNSSAPRYRGNARQRSWSLPHLRVKGPESEILHRASYGRTSNPHKGRRPPAPKRIPAEADSSRQAESPEKPRTTTRPASKRQDPPARSAGQNAAKQGFGKCRRHAPRTIHGDVTIKIRSRHSDFGYTRHLCSLHNLKGNANDSKVWRLGNRSTATPGFDVPDRDRAFFYRQTPPPNGNNGDTQYEIRRKTIVVMKKQQVLLLPRAIDLLADR